MPTHDGKLKKFSDVLMPGEVKGIVEDCSLLSLVDCSLTMIDSQQLTIFVKQWHKKTSFFHLPFSEMMIILDDVSSLFHIPLVGGFFIAHLISEDLACMTDLQDFGSY